MEILWEGVCCRVYGAAARVGGLRVAGGVQSGAGPKGLCMVPWGKAGRGERRFPFLAPFIFLFLPPLNLSKAGKKQIYIPPPSIFHGKFHLLHFPPNAFAGNWEVGSGEMLEVAEVKQDPLAWGRRLHLPSCTFSVPPPSATSRIPLRNEAQFGAVWGVQNTPSGKTSSPSTSRRAMGESVTEGFSSCLPVPIPLHFPLPFPLPSPLHFSFPFSSPPFLIFLTQKSSTKC